MTSAACGLCPPSRLTRTAKVDLGSSPGAAELGLDVGRHEDPSSGGWVGDGQRISKRKSGAESVGAARFSRMSRSRSPPRPAWDRFAIHPTVGRASRGPSNGFPVRRRQYLAAYRQTLTPRPSPSRTPPPPTPRSSPAPSRLTLRLGQGAGDQIGAASLKGPPPAPPNHWRRCPTLPPSAARRPTGAWPRTEAPLVHT